MWWWWEGAIAQPHVPERGFVLAARKGHKKQGRDTKSPVQALAARTDKTNKTTPHKSCSFGEISDNCHLKKQSRQPGREGNQATKDAPLSKVMWQPQLLGDQDGPLFGLGRRGFLLAKSQPREEKDLAELEGKQ